MAQGLNLRPNGMDRETARRGRGDSAETPEAAVKGLTLNPWKSGCSETAARVK